MCRAWASGVSVTNQTHRACGVVLFVALSRNTLSPAPRAQDTLFPPSTLRTHKRNETLSHAPFVLYLRSQPTALTPQSPDGRRSPPALNSEAFGLSTSAATLCISVAECSPPSAGVVSCGEDGFFAFIRLLRHLSKICAPNARKTIAMPTASIEFNGCAKKTMDNTTERNCRSVCIVAKTNGPKRLMV